MKLTVTKSKNSACFMFKKVSESLMVVALQP